MSKIKGFTARKIVITGVLGAISAVLGLTPLGFIPIGVTRATIMHIPVIIGAITEGPIVGGLVGLIFGLFSIFQAIANPTPVSFVFLNPIISVLPRILIGITSYYTYIGFKKLGEKASRRVLYFLWSIILIYLIVSFTNGIKNSKSDWILVFNIVLILLTLFMGYYSHKHLKRNGIELVMAAAVGTLTNTVGVMSGIYWIYGEEFVQKAGISSTAVGKAIVGIGVANGIPEIIVAIIITTSVIASLNKKGSL
jgi:uncharacterized membrane protein